MIKLKVLLLKKVENLEAKGEIAPISPCVNRFS